MPGGRARTWSNRGIDANIDQFNDARNAMAMVQTIRLLSNSTMAAPFFIAQVSKNDECCI